MSPIRIGTAGWSIPSHDAASFPGEGTHLSRYARKLGAVEINSSFYRPHRRATYARWAASVPSTFRFAVKLPRTITHDARLVEANAAIAQFAEQVAGLGAKLGVILVQLPPSLVFDEQAAACFATLKAATRVALVCEPRHASWFTPPADAALAEWGIARVAADPPMGPRGDEPGGWRGFTYHRLHGSPRMYYSAYAACALAALHDRMTRSAGPIWCIFDNTAAGAALGNALTLAEA